MTATVAVTKEIAWSGRSKAQKGGMGHFSGQGWFEKQSIRPTFMVNIYDAFCKKRHNESLWVVYLLCIQVWWKKNVAELGSHWGYGDHARQVKELKYSSVTWESLKNLNAVDSNLWKIAFHANASADGVLGYWAGGGRSEEAHPDGCNQPGVGWSRPNQGGDQGVAGSSRGQDRTQRLVESLLPLLLTTCGVVHPGTWRVSESSHWQIWEEIG